MSNAIICDECGRILKSSDALHCYEVLTKEGGTVYGADICKDCLPQFDRKADIHGWNLSYKKELKGRAAENQSVTNCNRLENVAKMREAFANISEYAKAAACHTEDAHLLGYLNQIEIWAEAALSTPPRNCDVGTPEELFKRFNMFCFPIKCRECKLYTEENLYDCIFRWLQLPYEKGDNE